MTRWIALTAILAAVLGIIFALFERLRSRVIIANLTESNGKIKTVVEDIDMGVDDFGSYLSIREFDKTTTIRIPPSGYEALRNWKKRREEAMTIEVPYERI